MTSNYADISQHNEKQLGVDRSSRTQLISLYADTAHFVYELLQNADDKGATEIHFNITSEGLIVEHNGSFFTEHDVRAISYFGKGNPDITKIGHFGLGFKSVFAYTASPRVHSGDENFIITELYTLNALPPPNDLRDGFTRFILPFDHETRRPDYIERRNLKSPDMAYRDICTNLAGLRAETLLFTKKLATLKWTTGTADGHYVRQGNGASSQSGREVFIKSGDTIEQCYLVFDRLAHWPGDDGKMEQYRPVQIAFPLTSSRKAGGALQEAEDAPLFVFFPTVIETHLGFYLQGPYRTNPSRETVPSDDPFNKHLVDETAELLIDAVDTLCSQSLLTPAHYDGLPISAADFKPNTFFRPLYERLRTAFSSKSLLPAHKGGYVSAESAYIPDVAAFAELFSPEQLGALFGTNTRCWLDTAITETKTREFYLYLVGKKQNSWDSEWQIEPLRDGIRIEATAIARKLNAAFFANQEESWLIAFYKYIATNYDPFKRTPFLRLKDGKTHVSPGSPSSPNAYLPPPDSSDLDLSMFAIVKPSLLKDDTLMQFLANPRAANLRPIDSAVIIIEGILPRYTHEPDHWDEKKYRVELESIRSAYADARGNAQDQLRTALAKTAFIACVRAAYPDAFAIFWVKPADTRLFLRSQDHETWFAELDVDAYFLHASVEDALDPELIDSLVRPRKTLWEFPGTEVCDLPTQQDDIKLTWERGAHRKSLNGFHPAATLAYVEVALQYPTNTKAKVLWRVLLDRPYLVCGVVLHAKRAMALASAPRNTQYSTVGQMLLTRNWLPTREGCWRRPGEIVLADLPADFESDTPRAAMLSRALKMEPPLDLAPLARAWNMTPQQIEQRRQLTDEEVKQILKGRSEKREMSDDCPGQTVAVSRNATGEGLRHCSPRTSKVSILQTAKCTRWPS
ncbi:hypothetical protein [uncultured Thiodictyon sp.]|uniref:sacsin N-terminal ATP-binding-like domain-containing protein n=1 Tax=uncultured Thiodictyon sp. TaxID=1846217 RepID=UPI002601262B|nr:hypothetical protein [uncultured Thiodictyon sp.]